jgi:hypothetical protein
VKHKLETFSSVWVLDTDSMLVSRTPVEESPAHASLSYREVGKPVTFLCAHKVVDPVAPIIKDALGYAVCVHLDQPRPNGIPGHRRIISGTVISSSLDSDEIGDMEECDQEQYIG